MSAPPFTPPREIALAGLIAEVSDVLERFRAFAQADAHPSDLDDRTRQLLAALSALTAARTAMQKAAAS